MESMKKIPVIIDCDPGVDDAYAIALAHSAPQFDIVAITAVEGNLPASVTRKNALCLCETLDIGCRVAFGAEKPLHKPYDRDASGTHGASGVGSVVFPDPKLKPDDKPAWDVIYEEAVKHGGELVLFAVGPLTNIALALRKYPDLPSYLKRFYIMGGGTFGNVSDTAEFNIWVDPTAAREVFSKLDVYMVGLNATHAASITGQDFDDMIRICSRSPKNWLLRDLSEFSKKNSMENGHDNNIIHDALAVAAAMDPDVATFEPYYVEVEDRDDAPNNGETVVDLKHSSEKQPNCHVAMQVNQPRFVTMLKHMCEYYSR